MSHVSCVCGFVCVFFTQAPSSCFELHAQSRVHLVSHEPVTQWAVIGGIVLRLMLKFISCGSGTRL